MSESVIPAALDGAALAELREMTGGDAEFLAEMIDTFLADGPTLVADMRSGATTGDAVLVRRAAHTLKSNSRTFGATALGDLCQEIEERAAAGNLDEATDLIGRVEGEYPAAAAALTAARPGS